MAYVSLLHFILGQTGKHLKSFWIQVPISFGLHLGFVINAQVSNHLMNEIVLLISFSTLFKIFIMDQVTFMAIFQLIKYASITPHVLMHHL